MALALRFYLALAFPSFEYPDEIYQATEQAHRLVFGYGVVPGEFRTGARSWLLPDALTAILAPAGWLGLGPQIYLPAISLALAALSLLPVWAAWDIGHRFGRDHALAAALTIAIAVPLPHDGLRPLTEVVATDFLLPAIALLTGGKGRARIFAGGLALGFAFVFRFHLAPALIVVALAAGRRDWRTRWLPMLGGVAAPLALLGIVDTLTWGAPFASILNNVHANAVAGRADLYGTAPALTYLTEIVARWSIVLLVALPFLGIGAARKPLLLAVAVVIIATHSLVPHKEYRFIYPALACLIVLAGLGLGECASLVRERWRGRRVTAFALPAALGLIIIGSAGMAFAPSTRHDLLAGRSSLDAFAALRADAGLCGLAIAGDRWIDLPGYSALHRNVPIYFWNLLATAGKQKAANIVVVPGDAAPADPAFARTACFDGSGGASPSICLYRRDGPCVAAPDLEINAVLAGNDQ